MATDNQKCVNCEKTGLPILPVRYSVLPKSVKAVMPGGISGARVTDVALDAHHYGLRTLREGWVYLFYEVGPRGNRYWEVYKVTPDGRLWKQTLPLPRVPVTDPACAQRAISVSMDLIAIEHPEKCTGRVFVAFSEYAWNKKVFDRYASDETLRKARMQFIKPSEWIANCKDANGHAIVATEQAIDDVIEYMPGFDPTLLAHPGDKQFFSDEKGGYKDEWLKREVTRYPTYIRQASPASASQALVKLMKQIGMKGQGSSGNSNHPPMILALWDSIANVHELNGFRCDPASWLDQYVAKERALHIGALQNIDTAQAIVQAHTDQELERQEQALSVGAIGPQSALAAKRAIALASGDPRRIAQINAEHDRNLATMRSYNWSKYEARVKRQEAENFRTKYKALQSTVFDLQESRSTDVGKWLKSKLFLDTLEDYQSTDLCDAVAFEVVITDGLAGIGSTPKGKAILDALVAHWDPLQPESLIWRVFAMNQKDARQELGQLLKIALEKKDMPLEPGQNQAGAGNSPGVDAVILAAGMIGKLNGYYKNLAKLALESDLTKITPVGGVLKRLQVDLFGLTVGDAIFAKFRINQLGDFVGEKIVQTVLLQRAGIPHSDTIALVRKQAELATVSRKEAIALIKARTLLRTGASTSAPKSTQALYAVWDAMKSTDEGLKALKSSRIAVVAALLEAINFYKIMTDAQDNDTSIKLMQSGASMLSSLITITMTPYYTVLKNSNRSLSWKLTGSGLSSFGTFISAWMDGEKTRDALHKKQFDVSTLYFLKTLTDGVTGVATLIDATSTSASVLKELAKRYGTKVVIEAAETVSVRVAAVAAMRGVGMLLGWEATAALIVLQAMADWLTPNELESWCSRCAFGSGRESILRIADHSVDRYTDASQQEKDFVNAMTNLS